MELTGSFKEIVLLRLDNKLADSGMIAQINKDKPAVIAFSVNPSAKSDGAVLKLRAQQAAIFGAETVLKSMRCSACSYTHSDAIVLWH